jgi:pimeloyl-ACP methyl ester carboxylesterase
MPDVNFHRAGTGEPLLLIHGIGSRWQVWLPVIERLARERDVIAIDLPGFGLSPMPPPRTPPGVETLTRMVAEFLAEQGLERPHVAGNSLGGWLALELARRGLARSATALSPAGFYNRAEAIYAHVTLWGSARAARLLRPEAARLLATPLGRRAVLSQLIGRPEQIPPSDAAEHLRALADAGWFDETLPAITRDRYRGNEPLPVPVTIAWGEHDYVLLPRQAARAARAVPNARLITLTGCGHVPTHDDPSQVARVLLEGAKSA